MPSPLYIGRFAPTPSGPLHFGSLINAVTSFCQARSQAGQWYLRIEDLDPPREVAGAADSIINTLHEFGFNWDGAILYQSSRLAAYTKAFEQLQQQQHCYSCACTRKSIAAIANMGTEGPIYPGTCRNGLHGQTGRSWRVLTSSKTIEFTDAIYGQQQQNLEATLGDFLIKRADGLFAYQLAAVVDDAYQGVTEVVRGADILSSTTRQIWLQQLLGYPTPQYFHHPLALNPGGEKLSKQTFAPGLSNDLQLNATQRGQTMHDALTFLNQHPPPLYNSHELLHWACENWRPSAIQPQNQHVAAQYGTPAVITS